MVSSTPQAKLAQAITLTHRARPTLIGFLLIISHHIYRGQAKNCIGCVSIVRYRLMVLYLFSLLVQIGSLCERQSPGLVAPTASFTSSGLSLSNTTEASYCRWFNNWLFRRH